MDQKKRTELVHYMQSKTPVFEFILTSFHNFNAAALKRALIDYHRHIQGGGKMFWAIAGAMSTGRLGIDLAPAIRNGLIHGLSVTGANLEESLVRLMAHSQYQNVYDYRYLSKADDEAILNSGRARVTDTLLPETAFNKVKTLMLPRWRAALESGKRRFWHEYFYDVITDPSSRDLFDGDPDECWLLAAAEKQLPIIVGGHADSSFGNIFAAECYLGSGLTTRT